MVKALASIPLVAGYWLAGAWFFMLTVGVIHAQWIPALPTIGFRVALVVGGVLGASAIIRSVLAVMLKEAIK